MGKILIVNADDFGLSTTVNLGIAEAHRTGLVRSASLIVNMPYVAQAADIARALPRPRDFAGSSIQELHGQRDISMNEAASIVGKAIGNPDVRYVQLPNSVLTDNLLKMGMPEESVDLILEMWEGANTGLISPLEQRSARNTTPTSLDSFVREEFAPAILSESH